MPPESYIRTPKDEDKSFHSDWIRKSRVNYFACFMELWVGFNAWFKQACDEMQDRKCIDKIKLGDISTNELFNVFDYLLYDTESKESLLFRGNLEALYYTLNAANLKYPKGPKSKANPDKAECRKIGFNDVLIDWKKGIYASAYQDYFIVLSQKPNERGKQKNRRLKRTQII